MVVYSIEPFTCSIYKAIKGLLLVLDFNLKTIL